ncbi:MAG: cyanophycinase [Planctomycetes bacterium]|nr:cyanophycinase [Planctomycetota bacterium]MCB9911932.1 cyanophycinase [Planctomycetota bacterium]HPF13554.1 cyanophycinase [Planctomycetota bacterium]HRV81144.1 cyanophycinase [Planctomycetota bacterium]
MTRGYVVPVGGAEEKVRDAEILRRFVRLCGGPEGRIAVIPTASKLADTGDAYAQIFAEMGARNVSVLNIEERSQGSDKEFLRILERANGVWMTGGNQLRLSTTLGGTPLSEMMRQRNAEDGLHVAGTSAGASILSEHMIAYGAEGPTPSSNKVTLAPGLGLIPWAIIDQHFRQRDRLGRLLSALAYNPRLIGLGLDEDTAAVFAPDDTMTVVGSGSITVVDATDVEFSSMDSANQSDPVTIIGVRLHCLTARASFDVKTRTARPPSEFLKNRKS